MEGIKLAMKQTKQISEATVGTYPRCAGSRCLGPQILGAHSGNISTVETGALNLVSLTFLKVQLTPTTTLL